MNSEEKGLELENKEKLSANFTNICHPKISGLNIRLGPPNFYDQMESKI